jgi:hypothetical protein
VTAIQRANSDLRLSPHFHTLFLDGVYAADRDGKGRMFHPAPAPSQEDIEQLVERTSKRILRFLERRGVITLVTAPGDGEVTVVTDESMSEMRPPLGNDRLSILDDEHVRIEFKRPWFDGTSSVELPPLALIARLTALVPPPRRYTVLYCGVLSSHASSRSQVVPAAPEAAPPEPGQDKPKSRPKYIRWSDLLRRVFGIETICPECQTPLRLISLIKGEPIAKKILVAMHLPGEAPELHPARPPPGRDREAQQAEDRVN